VTTRPIPYISIGTSGRRRDRRPAPPPRRRRSRARRASRPFPPRRAPHPRPPRKRDKKEGTEAAPADLPRYPQNEKEEAPDHERNDSSVEKRSQTATRTSAPGKPRPGRKGQAPLQDCDVPRAGQGKEVQRHRQEQDPVHHHWSTRHGRRPVRQGNEDRHRDLPGAHFADVRAEPAVHPSPDLFRHRGAKGFVQLCVVALESEPLGKSLHAAAREERPVTSVATEDRTPVSWKSTGRSGSPHRGQGRFRASAHASRRAALFSSFTGGKGSVPTRARPPLRREAGPASVRGSPRDRTMPPRRCGTGRPRPSPTQRRPSTGSCSTGNSR